MIKQSLAGPASVVAACDDSVRMHACPSYEDGATFIESTFSKSDPPVSGAVLIGRDAFVGSLYSPASIWCIFQFSILQFCYCPQQLSCPIAVPCEPILWGAKPKLYQGLVVSRLSRSVMKQTLIRSLDHFRTTPRPLLGRRSTWIDISLTEG